MKLVIEGLAYRLELFPKCFSKAHSRVTKLFKGKFQLCNLETLILGLTRSSITWHIMRPFITLSIKSLRTPTMDWLDVGAALSAEVGMARSVILGAAVS